MLTMRIITNPSQPGVGQNRLARVNDDYDDGRYPFDSQTCQMTFHVQGTSLEFINLIKKNFTYSGPTELMQYFIKKTYMENLVIDGIQMVQVEVVLGRRLLSIILTVYFPTILLNLIGYSTNFFKDFFFEAIVTVNLTSMLVLATMFINVSNNLPTTSCRFFGNEAQMIKIT